MIEAVYAQAAAPAAPSAGEQMLHMVTILAITVGIFYFMIIRPQQKRAKETAQMLASVRKGDRVLTTGGIYGTVIGVKDDVVVLKVSDDVKIEFVKSAIVQVKERGE
ncbi:MAG TPA: preprotein translocase subunit YajC [Candidatus Eisenbacteria bacterium]|nr:preprotein translocase subunit YajC [Candidatus Eisenbacteria bacterium]